MAPCSVEAKYASAVAAASSWLGQVAVKDDSVSYVSLPAPCQDLCLSSVPFPVKFSSLSSDC